MLDIWLDTIPSIILNVIMAVVPFVVGGLLIHWAFGGKKENKKKNDKLFETTAYLNAVQPTLPRRLR